MALAQLEESVVDGSLGGHWCILSCRSVRIGNYKVGTYPYYDICSKNVEDTGTVYDLWLEHL